MKFACVERARLRCWQTHPISWSAQNPADVRRDASIYAARCVWKSPPKTRTDETIRIDFYACRNRASTKRKHKPLILLKNLRIGGVHGRKGMFQTCAPIPKLAPSWCVFRVPPPASARAVTNCKANSSARRSFGKRRLGLRRIAQEHWIWFYGTEQARIPQTRLSAASSARIF